MHLTFGRHPILCGSVMFLVEAREIFIGSEL